MTQHRIGIDLGGTKIEIAVLAPDGSEALRNRVPTPPGYPATIAAIAQLVQDTEAELGITATVGIGIPGVISPATGRVKNANSTTLNGHPFDQDISALLDREVRVENDANCFTLSEAADGAGAGYRLVFGVILGTGVGGGIAVDGGCIAARTVAGEWGHNPLPWTLRPNTRPAMLVRPGAAWRPSSPAQIWRATATDRRRATPAAARARRRRRPARAACPGAPRGPARPRPRAGHQLAGSRRHRAGRRTVEHGTPLRRVAGLLPRHVFSDVIATPILQNRHGDSSGVRGAAWLWPAA